MSINKGKIKLNATDSMYTFVWIIIFIAMVYLIGIVIPDFVGDCSISMPDACFR